MAAPSRKTLDRAWAPAERPAAPPARWSRRRTAAFLALTCGGFWTCVVVAAAHLGR